MKSAYLTLWLLVFCSATLRAEVGDEKEPVRYIGKVMTSNSDYKNGYHDGQMQVAIGVQNY